MKRHDLRPPWLHLVLVVSALGGGCTRVAPDEGSRPRPTSPPPPKGIVLEQTCVGRSLADKAMLGTARDPEHGCPSSLDGKLYITSQWPPPITLEFQENPGLDPKFTAAVRSAMPKDTILGPACCYVITKSAPRK